MKQVLCFGDSNTFGYVPHGEVRDASTRLSEIIQYPREIRWTGQLVDRIKPLGYEVIEEGLCGRTTIFDDPWCKGRNGMELLPSVLKRHPQVDLMIIMLGTNDCKTVYNASPEKIGEGLEQLVHFTKSFDPQIKILLISPILIGEEIYKEEFDPDFGRKSVETSKKLKPVFEKVAIKNGCLFMAASDFATPSPVDLEHLSPEGHQNLSEAIYNKLVSEL